MVALAEAFVKIRPDTRGFRREAERGINPATEGRRMGTALGGGLVKGFADSGGVFAKVVAVTAARATLAGSAAAAAAPGVVQLTSALVPAAGAAAALPAALLAIKAASGVVKLAVAGVGDAIQEGITGDAKKAREEIAKLPPEARKFATAVVGMRGQLRGLQVQVSNRFFRPFNDDISGLASRYLPMLRSQLSGMAGPLGGLVEGFAQAARRGTLFAGVRDTLNNTRIGLIYARDAVGPLTNALGNLLRVGAPVVRQLGEGFGSVGARIGNFINEAARTGQLKTFLQGGIDTLRTLGGIIANVGGIFRAVYGAATASGNNLLFNLRELTGQARAFLESGKGSSALTSVFSTLSTLGAALRTSLGAVLPAVADSVRALAPAVGSLAPAFAQLVVAVAPLLPYFTQIAAAALKALVPAVSALAGWLQRNENVMKPLALTIGGIVLALKAFAVASAIGAAATRVHTAATATNTAIQKVWNSTFVTRLRVLAIDAGAWVRSTAATVANTVATTANRVATAVSSGVLRAFVAVKTFELGAWVRTTAATVANTAAIIAQRAAAIAANVASKAMAAGVWLVNAALRANPIGLVITAITLLIGAIVLAYRRHEGFRNIVQAVWSTIKTWIKGVADWFTGTAMPSIRRAIDQGVTAFNWLRDKVGGAVALVRRIVEMHVTAVTRVFNGLKTFISQTLPNAFSAGVNGIRTAWSRVQDAAKKPVTFVVRSVINPLIRGFNKVAGVFGVGKVGEIPGFASGGRIPGAPSSTDNRTGTLTDRSGRALGPIKVATGEYIVNARDTAKALPLLNWINKGMRGGTNTVARYLGRPLTDRPGDGSEGWAFAKGGLVGFLKDAWGAISNPAKFIKAPVEAALSRIPGGGKIREFLMGMGRKLTGGLTSWLTGQSGGTAGGAVGKAQSFIRGQAGKPYIWASAGPRGYDCSGIVSAAWNILKGRSPYSHTFSTASLPGRYFPKPGRGGPLTAGWSHPGQRGASAGTGHMAGELLGMPFESRGSTGVLVGPRARRVSGFAHMGHFAKGGLIPPVRLFDSGGAWPSGTFGYNGSGRTEYVEPNFSNGGGRDVHIHLHNHGVIASQREHDAWLSSGLQRLKQGRKLAFL